MANDKTSKPVYDLEERTAAFGENVVRFCKKASKNVVTIPLITQLVKSGTSIGANYCEADDAESRKDFAHKIGICKKEARETKYWFRMIATAIEDVTLLPEARVLWQEAKELNLIFNKIVRSTKANNQK